MKGNRVFLATFFLMVFILNACDLESAEKEEQNHPVIEKNDIILQKNFPFISTVLRNDQLHIWMNENESLKILSKTKQQRLIDKLNLIDQLKFHEVDTISNLFQITEIEIETGLEEWMNMLESNWLKTVLDSLRSTKQFYRFNDFDDKDFIRKVWENELNGVNRIISIYATGEKPRYPAIDSVSYNVQTERFKRLINITAHNVLDDVKNNNLFFEPSLNFALWLLEINNRDEAARFEPMEQGENLAAVEQVARTNWEQYPYSVILIPGAGPEKHGIVLSAMGKMRCKLAADRYRKKLAPFIILSGGFVHPFQTPYCEALEMKNELMKTYRIPEYAIIIEPHARHTTTNFRNAARLIYKYRIPFTKIALCTTTLDQSYYITNLNFDQRCERELGYIPYELGERLNRNDVEFYPLMESCTQDCIDPLDP